MKRRKLSLTMLVFVLLTVLVLSGCDGTNETPEGDEVTIGFVGAQTGPSATMGMATCQGVELAVEEINEAGGILGKKVKFVSRDDEADPTKSKTAVMELIDKEGIQMLVASPNSTCVAASEDYVNQNKVIQIINIATNTDLIDEERYPYTFRTMIPSSAQSKALVRIAKDAGFEKIALLGDTTALGVDGVASLREDCKEAGIVPVAEVTYKTEDADMTPVAEKIKRAGADCVLAWTLGADGAKIVAALSRIDYMDELIYLGYTGLLLPNFRELAGDGIDRCFTINGTYTLKEGETELDKDRQELYDKVTAKYGKYGPGGRTTVMHMVATAYDAIYVYKWAVETAGTFDADAVKETLENKISEYPMNIGYGENKYNFSPESHEAVTGKDLVPAILDPMATTDKIFGDIFMEGTFSKE